MDVADVKIDCDKYKGARNLWVDRDGQAYEIYDRVNYLSHSDFASYCGIDGVAWVHDLEDRGWIHVSSGDFLCFQQALTSKQKQFIKDWAIFNGTEYSLVKFTDLASERAGAKWIEPERRAKIKEFLKIEITVPLHSEC